MTNNGVAESNKSLKKDDNSRSYVTVYVMNIDTGKPFIFDVPCKILERLEQQKSFVSKGQAPLLGDSVVELVEGFEFSLFPAYKEVLKIFLRNGFTIELITKILRDFGAGEPFIQELLKDRTFTSRMIPWFEGIARDGERATRTLKVVYAEALSRWKSGAVDVVGEVNKVDLLG